MIRLMLVILGVFLGLGAVVVTEGRVVHLRQFAPSVELQWAAKLTETSGLMRGEATNLQLSGLPVPAQLNWVFERMDMHGPVWRVALGADGLEGSGNIGLLSLGRTTQLSDGNIELALDQLPKIAGGVRVGGVLNLENVLAEFKSSDGSIIDLQAQAQWLGAQIDGHKIGIGELSLVSDENGGWRAPFQITGDVVSINGVLFGQFDQSEVLLDVTIEDAGAMPADWKQALNQQVSRKENGWSFRRDLDLAQGWPVF